MPRRRKAQSGSSFQATLAVANSEGYLGNARVVENLVRDFVANSLEATSPDSIVVDSERLALIFSGSEASFTPIPEWNTHEALGMKCCERRDLPFMSFAEILRMTFLGYAEEARGIMIDHAKDPEEAWGWKIDQIIEHCTSLMLGTIDKVFPQEPNAHRQSQSESSFQEALAVANSEGYLGNAKVVEDLVRGFVANCVEATGPETIYADCDRLALIFSGNEPGFTPIPEWNTREALGMKCCERHDLDPNQSFVDILRATFATYAVDARDILIEHAKDPEEDWGWKIDGIIEHCTSLMIGTIDTLYPQDPDEPPIELAGAQPHLDASKHQGGLEETENSPSVIYECSSPEEIRGEYVDGMAEMLGDDILSSDFDPTIESWPGVNPIPLPPEIDVRLMAERQEERAEDPGYHWADDRYFTDALTAWYRRRDRGLRFITIDMQALERVAFNGGGPAYKLMEAMCSVKQYEGWEGCKGAPRVLFAALLRMAEMSGTTDRIAKTRRTNKDEPEGA